VTLSAPDRPLHGQPVPHDRLHPQLYLAEAAGTALLVSLGLSLWIYAIAPLLGAVLAVALLRINLLGRHQVTVARVARHDH
jgi:hypothetical protein